MRVLIGVDGSPGGNEAARQAGLLTAPDRDQIALYYSPPKVEVRREARLPGGAWERARNQLAEEVFREALAYLPEKSRPRVERIVGEKAPRQGLKLAAEGWQADLIVVGTRGAGGVAGAVLGSVARALLHSTTTPVLLARPKADKRTDGTYRVLLAIDEAPKFAAATRVLAEVAWPAKTRGEVIHVVQPLFGAEIPEWLKERARVSQDEPLSRAWLAEFEAEKRHKFDELKTYAATLPPQFAAAAPVVLEGWPPAKIIETATDADADLLVVGSRGLGTLERFLLGSTTENLLSHAPCSVLVLHYGAQP